MTPATLHHLLHQRRLRPNEVASHERVSEAKVKRLMARYGIGPWLKDPDHQG